MSNVPVTGHRCLPAISVVMPTFNDGQYLREAIDSILGQTFKDFEFIIINDCSNDVTENIINSYKDDRIRYLKNEANYGNTITRNRGMKAAIGKYIAIMDSDDISVPKRLALQYQYLEKHPEIGILGGSEIFFDENSWFYRRYPPDPEYIKSFLFFKNAVGQPTVMLRREIISKYQLYYNPDYENGEDFDIWYRAAIKGVRISNLKKVMLYYRQSESQMSHPANAIARVETLKTYFRDKLSMLGLVFDEVNFISLHNFIRGRIGVSKKEYILLNELLKTILEANKQKRIFDNTSFRAVIFAHRLRLIKYAFFDKKNLLVFAGKCLQLATETGMPSLWQYWRNEGRFGRNFGANKIIFQHIR